MSSHARNPRNGVPLSEYSKFCVIKIPPRDQYARRRVTRAPAIRFYEKAAFIHRTVLLEKRCRCADLDEYAREILEAQRALKAFEQRRDRRLESRQRWVLQRFVSVELGGASLRVEPDLLFVGKTAQTDLLPVREIEPDLSRQSRGRFGRDHLDGNFGSAVQQVSVVMRTRNL